MASAANSLRRDVLTCYKRLLRMREKIFVGDEHALQFTKEKAREHFQKNKTLTDPEEIRKALKIGRDSIEVLRTTIVQGRLNENGNYRIKIEDQHLC